MPKLSNIIDSNIKWLLAGDVSIQCQVHRDLLGEQRQDLQYRIETEGWGKQFLEKGNKNGWGQAFYQPKWISTHYTLLDLKHLGLNPRNAQVQKIVKLILAKPRAEDGGIQLGPSTSVYSDVCVNGMFLIYASYFKAKSQLLHPIVDAILHEKMADGGFNCRTTRSGAKHSSLHTTISVLEGLFEFQKRNSRYRKTEVSDSISSCTEFILQHQFFLSDRTGEIIHPDFLKLRFPCRWKYDILRALDCFALNSVVYDQRMDRALEVLINKRTDNYRWKLNAKHPGKTHFDMEKAGQKSRWNTLRALRVLKQYNNESVSKYVS